MSPRKHSPSWSLVSPLLLLLLCVLLPHVALSQRREACHACVPDSVRNQTAIGFDLGQSYSTSVAHLDNGTTINLAKVPGSPRYIALIERLMRTPPPPNGSPREPVWWGLTRTVLRTIGLPANREIAVLSKMAAALKADTKATLGGQALGMVAVTTPWQEVWRDDDTLQSNLYDALVVAGVEPWTYELGGGPLYWGEINTALGANGRWLCDPYDFPYGWCGYDDERDTYTNRSLYTSFQQARCFYKYTWEMMSSIDAEYGLDEMAKAATPAQFWDAVRARLAARVAEYSRWSNNGHRIPMPLEIVVVAGEAGDNPDFLAVVREIVRDIPGVGAADGKQGTAKKAAVDLIVSDDPAFAAARGAALLSRVRLEGHFYCDNLECFNHEPQYFWSPQDKDSTHVKL